MENTETLREDKKIRDDEEFMILKREKEDGRNYGIWDRKNDVWYDMDIVYTDANILISVDVTKENATRHYSRGSKVLPTDKNPYAVECNFLSTLKMKKNTDGELIRALLKLTSDEILQAPSKVAEKKKQKQMEKREIRRRAEEAKRREENEIFKREHGGIDKETYLTTQKENEGKIDATVMSLIKQTKTHSVDK